MRKTARKTISLPPETLKKGTKRARERGFKNSFSAYVAHRIDEDSEAIKAGNGKGER